MQSKEWLNSTAGAFIIAIAMTVLVCIETMFSPSAPFFWLYAALAIAIPIYAGMEKFSWAYSKFTIVEYWKIMVVIFIGMEVWDIGSNLGFQAWMNYLGKGDDFNFSMNAAIPHLASVAAARLGTTQSVTLGLYGLFFMLWAPIGEEFFYRGYLQKNLTKKLGSSFAIIIMALIFGLRHSIHFLYLWPELPIGPMIFWAINATVIGALLGVLYKKTNSVSICIVAHFLANVIIFFV